MARSLGRVMVRLGVIGGTGLIELTAAGEFSEQGLTVSQSHHLTVSTPYGAVPLHAMTMTAADGTVHELVFLQRHHQGNGHGCPPHIINHRANMRAMEDANLDLVVAVCSVGTLHPNFPPGTVGLAHQYIDFTGVACTFHDGSSRFTSATTPFSPAHNSFLEPLLRQAQGLSDQQRLLFTYWLTAGPQFETPAEVDAIERLGGDMVGMTMPREAKLALELSLPYVAICISSNWAAGREPGDASKALNHEEVSAQANDRLKPIMACLAALLNEEKMMLSTD